MSKSYLTDSSISFYRKLAWQDVKRGHIIDAKAKICTLRPSLQAEPWGQNQTIKNDANIVAYRQCYPSGCTLAEALLSYTVRYQSHALPMLHRLDSCVVMSLNFCLYFSTKLLNLTHGRNGLHSALRGKAVQAIRRTTTSVGNRCSL